MSPEQKNAPESKMFYKLHFDLKMLCLQPLGLGADELYMIQTLIGTPAGAFLLKKDVFHAGRRWQHQLALHQQEFQEQKQQKEDDTLVHAEITLGEMQVQAGLQQGKKDVMSPETLLLAAIEVAEDKLKKEVQADVIAQAQRELQDELQDKLEDEIVAKVPCGHMDALQNELVDNLLDQIQDEIIAKVPEPSGQMDELQNELVDKLLDQIQDEIVAKVPCGQMDALQNELVDKLLDQIQDEIQEEAIEQRVPEAKQSFVHKIDTWVSDEQYLPRHPPFTTNDATLRVQEAKELPSVKTHCLIARKDYAGCFETLLRTFNLLVSTQNVKKQQEEHYRTLHLNLSTLVVYIETLMLDPMHLTDKENHIWHHIALDNKAQSKQDELTAQDDINKLDWRLQLQQMTNKIQHCKNKTHDRSQYTSARRNRPSSGLSWRQET